VRHHEKPLRNVWTRDGLQQSRGEKWQSVSSPSKKTGKKVKKGTRAQGSRHSLDGYNIQLQCTLLTRNYVHTQVNISLSCSLDTELDVDRPTLVMFTHFFVCTGRKHRADGNVRWLSTIDSKALTKE